MNALAGVQSTNAIEAQAMAPNLTHAQLEQAIAHSLPRLMRLAVRLSGDDEIAEEAVQDALLRVAKSWKSFRGEAALETWVTRIVIHCVRDRMKAAKQSSRNVSGLDTASPQREPSDEALAAERQQAVGSTIASLPERQREVLTLR